MHDRPQTAVVLEEVIDSWLSQGRLTFSYAGMMKDYVLVCFCWENFVNMCLDYINLRGKRQT